MAPPTCLMGMARPLPATSPRLSRLRFSESLPRRVWGGWEGGGHDTRGTARTAPPQGTLRVKAQPAQRPPQGTPRATGGPTAAILGAPTRRVLPPTLTP